MLKNLLVGCYEVYGMRTGCFQVVKVVYTSSIYISFLLPKTLSSRYSPMGLSSIVPIILPILNNNWSSLLFKSYHPYVLEHSSYHSKVSKSEPLQIQHP
jgi:hypothetical protein